MEGPMDKPFDAKVTTGGDAVPGRLRGYSAVVGGVAAGFVLVGLGAYALGTVKGTLGPSVCETQPISIVLGRDAEAAMTVSRRTRCQLATSLATAAIEEFTIVDPPKHGTLMPRGRTAVVYQSDGDFRGHDSFAFAMRGKPADISETSTGETSVVRAYVTVK
jgi:hypothetical protein